VAVPPRKLAFLVGGGLAALIGLDLIAGWHQESRRERAFQHAMTTQGVVTGKRSEHVSTQSRNSIDAHYISFNYSVGRKSYNVEQNVIGTIYNSVERGTPIRIFYVPADPADGVVERPTRGWVLLILGAIALALGLEAVFIGLRGDASG